MPSPHVEADTHAPSSPPRSQSVLDIGIMLSATASAKLISSWVVNLKPLFLGGMMISGADDDVYRRKLFLAVGGAE